MLKIKTGLEVLREDGYKPLRGQRVGLFTNASAINSEFDSAYFVLWRSERVNLVALFAPEHGLTNTQSAGEPGSSHRDLATGLDIHNLYGQGDRPKAEMLANVDVLVCDIQDIGIRYHTYVWTISRILEAAGEAGVTVVILDRPNPLGGKTIYGPSLEQGLSSQVGRYPIPVRHSLTLGELVWMINETWNPHLARLSIIPCENWRREMIWSDTKLPWVPPSPDIPCERTLSHYAGACLVEGTNLSEGRGTTLPFEVLGTPWIDAIGLAQHLNRQDWCERFGVRFRAHQFQPLTSKYAGEYCKGVQVYITDKDMWRPIEAWLSVIAEIRHLYPERFEWLPPQKEGGLRHFDRLIGTRRIRESIDMKKPVHELSTYWAVIADDFAEARKPFLLYE